MTLPRIASITVAAGLLALCCHQAAHAAVGDPREANRDKLNGILSVLQLRSDATSAGCVSALEEMHTAEDQLKSLSDATDEPTESQRHANRQDNVAVAQDVLESDIDNAITACRPDAKAVCANPPSGGGRRCSAL